MSYGDPYRMIRIPTDHPHKRKSGYIGEHTLIVERRIGRRLKRGEVVHHIDGNRLNNDPSNLQLMASQAEHMALHPRVGRNNRAGPEYPVSVSVHLSHGQRAKLKRIAKKEAQKVAVLIRTAINEYIERKEAT